MSAAPRSRTLPTWPLAVLSMELRKTFSYRIDFWIGFLGNFAAEFLVAWFVWVAVFANSQTGLVGGMTFQQMILYSMVAPILTSIMHGPEMHFISREIYDGSLSRYIVYPLPFLRYKYIAHLTSGLVGVAQSLLILAAILGFALFDAEPHASVATYFGAVATALIAGVTYFLLASAIEMVAFWAENVWSLMVMLKFIIRLMGGGMLPLAIYPEWAQGLLKYTPFPWLIHFPIQVALGKVSWMEWTQGMVVLAIWGGVCAVAAVKVWWAGSRHYSGIGA